MVELLLERETDVKAQSELALREASVMGQKTVMRLSLEKKAIGISRRVKMVTGDFSWWPWSSGTEKARTPLVEKKIRIRSSICWEQQPGELPKPFYISPRVIYKRRITRNDRIQLFNSEELSTLPERNPNPSNKYSKTQPLLPERKSRPGFPKFEVFVPSVICWWMRSNYFFHFGWNREERREKSMIPIRFASSFFFPHSGVD